MLNTITLENKEALQSFRKKNTGITEAKLLYRAGNYVLTYFNKKVSDEGLMLLGYKKKSKELKKKLESGQTVYAV